MRIALHPRDPIAVALAYVDKSTVVRAKAVAVAKH